eukprot:GHVU01200544.1.p1 GENE.GHVU01200544.1~~GHVU01200544.1.p1  ORF type:complete len:554 (-),score=142.38 GHVU01200544.1:2063-3724(-)
MATAAVAQEVVTMTTTQDAEISVQDKVAEAAAVGNGKENHVESNNVEASTAQQGNDKAADGVVAQPDKSKSAASSSASAAKSGQAQAPTKSKSSKKKEDKSIEHILRALSGLQSTEEKLAALCKKYTDLLEDHRMLQAKFKQNQRSLTTIMREKEQLHAEHGKSVLAKSKLESLCRELQRHNKLIKEESLARAREEEEKRKEVTNRFQSTINDIQQQMNDNHTKNTKLREENLDLSTKLKSLIEQYEAREEHIQKLFAHKELEQQLVDAKFQQATLQMTEEKEKNIMEKTQILTDAAEAHKKIQLMEAQEKQLRAQVALYTEKYEEFQQTLQKSNEVFQSFKTEMDKMTKKIKKLEKDTSMWRSRWESSNKALIDMAEEKTKNEKEITTLLSKVQKLESLCRALQAERKKASPPPPPPTETNSDLAAALGSVPTNKPKQASEIEETKTPPNTPDQSRASPATVQSEDTENKDSEANSSAENDSAAAGDQSGQQVTESQSEESSTGSEATDKEPAVSEAVAEEKKVDPPCLSEEEKSAAPSVSQTDEADIEAVD